jgi:hypothetical protein
MELNTLILVIVAIMVILTILKIVFKTIKIVFFIGIILITIVLLYDYYQPMEKDYDKLSIYDCEFDNECMYVVDASNCNLVAERCNNMIKMENYVVNGKRCNKEGIVIDENITCNCIIGDDLSYCKQA